MGLVKKDLGTTPAAIVEVIKERYHYNISYGKAYCAKNKVLKHLFGGWGEAYLMLPQLIQAIQITNPGTDYREWSDPTNLEGTNILRGFFWSFGPIIRAFDHCISLLSIDGTYLYGKYKGVPLVTMAVDANGQLLPLAYALVEKESNEIWNWFMFCIRELVTQRDGICVISDRHAGIVNVFRESNGPWAPPRAYHRWCMRHFAQNFYSSVNGKSLVQDLKDTCKENQRCKFEKRHKELIKDKPRARRFLENKPLQKWSLANDSVGRRFGMMTTNISEVYNNVLKGARGLSVAAILELTFYRTVEYFRTRRTIANAEHANGTVWVEEIFNHLERKRVKANNHHVRPFDDGSGLYEIITQTRQIHGMVKGGRTHTVNLELKLCTCGKIQLLHYPCSHVLAACAFRALDYNQFISPYYSVEFLFRTWSQQLYPIPDTSYWEEYEGPKLIPDESLKHVKEGSRKSRQIRNDMDTMKKGEKTRCRNCRQEGHNVRKFPARIG